MNLDAWQEEVLRAGLGERSDGRWSTRQIGVSTPRQNGKTMLIVARALAGLLLFGEKIIIVSAHRQDTARESFNRLVEIIEDNPDLEERVDFIARSENREFIRMKSGQEVRFKARSTGSGRGFSCDCLLLDEAQILGAAAWSAILPTMSARPNPQVWLLGTPPTPNDDGEVFTRIRNAGLEGTESSVAYLEWSATREDDFDAPETWAKANPAYGIRIGPEAVAAERASMSDDQFAMERLGIWEAVTRYTAVVKASVWQELADVGPDFDVLPDALAVDMSHGRHISIAACWREDDSFHIEEVWAGVDPNVAMAWIVQAVRRKRRMPVVIDGLSPANNLIPALRNKRVMVNQTNATDMAKACGTFLDAIQSDVLTHGGQDAVDDALEGARKRPIGTAGGWGWNRKDETVNIAPLVAVTLALFGASTTRRSSRSVPTDDAGQPSSGSTRRSGGRARTSSRRRAVSM